MFYVLIYDVLLFQRALLVFSLFFPLTSLRIGWEVPAVNEEGGKGEESSIPGQRASRRGEE